ncbi:hypothetical protein [Frigoribacterium sp. SL97]|uniref:hypothetical protein n=1 Tax=Frigoribacterium sp. SL97 TaxID=2994664 RepID=UPI00227162BF|nr:hypothetical protein [Frigoribacterium sp. SL97]WAC50528.1 hypothetical protein OVA02_11660 [Frigoribacterium sp. SL97]
MTRLPNGERPNEVAARRIVSDVLGVPVERYEGVHAKRNSMPDALIRSSDGDIPLEVISDTDGKYTALWSELDKLEHFIALPAGQSSWMIQVAHNARIKRLPAVLPGFLAALPYRSYSQHERGFPDALRMLGITAAEPSTPDRPGVAILAEGFNSWDRPGDLNRFVTDTLSSAPDVAAKLLAHTGGIGPAHAFVWTTIRSHFSATKASRNDDYPLPSSPLELPAGLTDIWVGSSWRDHEALHYVAGGGWSRTGWLFTDEMAAQLPLDLT